MATLEDLVPLSAMLVPVIAQCTSAADLESDMPPEGRRRVA